MDEEVVEVIEEEVIVEDNEENEQEPESEPIIEDNEETEKAKKYGHLSKEDWIAAGKDPALWKSPSEFNKTGEIIEQLISLKKKVDQRDREIESLVKYQERTAQREYEKARQDLEARLSASKDDMDMEGVAHYTKELTRLEGMEQQNHYQHAQQLQQQAQQSFIERNQHWFNDRNPDLKNRAIEIDNELKEIYPNATYDDLARKIETRMQYEYPERVMGQTRTVRPNVSQSSVNKTAAAPKNAFKGLSQEHKDTFNVYKRINPKVTEADFIQKLKADGEI